MMETNNYKLYAVRLSAINQDDLQEFKYSLCSNSTYALIFTDKQLKEPYCVVDSSIPLLPEESQWLLDVKTAINTKTMQKNENEYREMLSNFCNTFEKELKKEKRKENKKNKPKMEN